MPPYRPQATLDKYRRRFVAKGDIGSVAPTLEEQLTAAIAKRNIPRVKLEADENGHAVIDKDKHPEIYDWAVNG